MPAVAARTLNLQQRSSVLRHLSAKPAAAGREQTADASIALHALLLLLCAATQQIWHMPASGPLEAPCWWQACSKGADRRRLDLC